MGLKTTPAFRITGPNESAYNTRATLIILKDNPGYQTDTLKITLSTSDLTHNIKSGDQIRLEWGYKESDALFDMGMFTVSKAKPLFLPKRLEVVATANEFHINAPSKARRSQTYSGLHVFQIVSQIANRLNLTSKVHNSLAEKFFVHLDQKNESDLSFLQRLASYYDAVAKAVDGQLIFAPRGLIKNQSGETLEPISLIVPTSSMTAPYNALITLNVEIPEREQFMGVKADFHNQNVASSESVQVGAAPFANLPGRFTDSVQATNAAEAELSRIKRQSLKCTFSAPGNPEIMAEGPINITGADERVDGDWSCDQIEHRWDVNSFTTSGSASAVVR